MWVTKKINGRFSDGRKQKRDKTTKGPSPALAERPERQFPLQMRECRGKKQKVGLSEVGFAKTKQVSGQKPTLPLGPNPYLPPFSRTEPEKKNKKKRLPGLLGVVLGSDGSFYRIAFGNQT